MKQLLSFIYEAKKKPSALTKFKGGSEAKQIDVLDGDVYDLKHGDSHKEYFQYYSGEGNGYIMDKSGKIYDVITSEHSGDAGRIAGGSYSWYVTIKNVDGKGDIELSGWSGIMSKTYGATIISDIKAGMYLEDYVLKNWQDIKNNREKWEYLKEKGDANAKSSKEQKEENRENKKQKFAERYLPLPDFLQFSVTNDNLNVSLSRIASKHKDIQLAYNKYSNSENEEVKAKNKEELENVKKTIETQLSDILKPILVNIVNNVFKTKSISSLNGISGSFIYKYAYENKTYNHIILLLDTKDKKIVKGVLETAKIYEDSKIEYRLNDLVTIDKTQMSSAMEKLFKTVAKHYKEHIGNQGDYVEKRWLEIHKESYSYWGYNKTKTQSKKEAIEEYKKLVINHSWTKGPDKLNFPLSLIQLYVEGDMTTEDEPIEKPLENPEQPESKERGKNTVMSKSAVKAAEEKMLAWHEGRRKQNLSNCSDAKLKMNYKVCKSHNYEKEIALLQQEANKRGITLESLTYKDYIELNS